MTMAYEEMPCACLEVAQRRSTPWHAPGACVESLSPSLGHAIWEGRSHASTLRIRRPSRERSTVTSWDSAVHSHEHRTGEGVVWLPPTWRAAALLRCRQSRSRAIEEWRWKGHQDHQWRLSPVVELWRPKRSTEEWRGLQLWGTISEDWRGHTLRHTSLS